MIAKEKKYTQCRKCERYFLSKLEKCPYCSEPKILKGETVEKQKSILRKLFRR